MLRSTDANVTTDDTATAVTADSINRIKPFLSLPLQSSGNFSGQSYLNPSLEKRVTLKQVNEYDPNKGIDAVCIARVARKYLSRVRRTATKNFDADRGDYGNNDHGDSGSHHHSVRDVESMRIDLPLEDEDSNEIPPLDDKKHQFDAYVYDTVPSVDANSASTDGHESSNGYSAITKKSMRRPIVTQRLNR